MRRSQSVKRALYALVVLILFMVVLRSLRPESSASALSEAHTEHAGHAEHVGHAEHAGAAVAAPRAPVLAGDPPAQAAPDVPSGPPFDAEAAYKEIVYDTPTTPVVIFSKSYCPHSKRAKQLLLEEHSIVPQPKVVELDLHPHGAELQDFIESITGRRTVPNVLVNGVSRGGASDMVALEDQLVAQFTEWGAGTLKIETKMHIQPV